MKETVQSTPRDATERAALRRCVKRFCHCFNVADWEACYALIDPELKERGKAKLDSYSELMQAFKNLYGRVNPKPQLTSLSLHLEGAPKQRDKRPFAFVYVVWQDEAHGFHTFRERWIQDHGRWFTRVVGLVPSSQPMDSRQD